MARARTTGAARAPGKTSGNRQTRIRQALAAAAKGLRTGDPAKADAIARDVLAADPMNLDALHLRASVAHIEGRTEEAVALLKRIVKLNPAHAEAHTDLGHLMHRMGRFNEAVGHLTDALKAAPKLAGAHLNLGHVYRDLGNLIGAEAAYRAAIRHKPDMAEAHSSLSAVRMLMGFAGPAVESARKAVKLRPGSARVRSRLAMALDRAGDFEGAIVAHEKAAALEPESIPVHMDHARTLAQHGRIEEAVAKYREILARQPDRTAAYASMGRLIRYEDADHPDIVRMQGIRERKGLGDGDRCYLGFALGKAYEDCGLYEQAFAAFAEGNRAARKAMPYDRRRTDAQFDDVTRAFDQLDDSLANPDIAPRPIFVLGMPRSGTSLVEQILSSHPDVTGAGEMVAMNECGRHLRESGPDGTLAGAMKAAHPARMTDLAERYMALTRGFAEGGALVVDKSPSNFLNIGLIRLMFPEALIIHCRRNPADTALSIYKTNFTTGVPYAFEAGEIAHYYRHHLDLMAHWHRVLPGFVHIVDYEALIDDQEGESRKLLDRCGLDWDDRVLAFHESAHAVHTASIAQVRQPIYRASSGIAARYGAAAAPLTDALVAAGVAPAAGGDAVGGAPA